MTLDLLFPNFAEIVRTPADVAALNQAILNLAVRGRLVAQDAGDEPAKMLLERCRQIHSSGEKKIGLKSNSLSVGTEIKR